MGAKITRGPNTLKDSGVAYLLPWRGGDLARLSRCGGGGDFEIEGQGLLGLVLILVHIGGSSLSLITMECIHLAQHGPLRYSAI